MLDTTTLKLEADSSGLVEAVKRLRELPPAAEQAERGAKRLGAGIGAVDKAAVPAGRAMKTLGADLAQTAREMAQTGDVGRALGNSLPQIAAGFGGIGLAIGGVLSVGIPLLDLWLTSGDEAKDLTQRMKDLDAASRRVADASKLAAGGADALIERYGEATAQVRELVAELRQVAIDDAAAASELLIGGTFARFTDELVMDFEMARQRIDGATGDMLTGVVRLAEELKLTAGDASVLSAAMREAEDAKGVRERIDALHEVGRLLNAQRDAHGRLTEEQRALLREVIDTEERLQRSSAEVRILEGNTNSATGAARELAGAWGGVASAIAGAVTSAQDAVRLARIDLATVGDPVTRAGARAGAQFDATFGNVHRDDGLIPSTGLGPARTAVIEAMRQEELLRQQLRALEHPPAPRVSGGSGGGGGAVTGTTAALREEASAYEDVIDALKREKAAIGETELARRQIHEIRDAEVSSTSAEADNIRALTAEIYAMEEAQEIAAERALILGDSLSDLFKGAIGGAEDFTDALGDVSSRLSDILLDKAFNSFAGYLVDGFTSALVGGFGKPKLPAVPPTGMNTNFYADGTDFAAGGLSIVGERGPEIVHLPRGSAVTPNHRLGEIGGGVVLNFTSHVDARGADAAAVARIEAGQRKQAAEFEARVVKTVRDARAGRSL